jgi:hypothetical protein
MDLDSIPEVQSSMPRHGSFDNECTPEARNEVSLSFSTKQKTHGLESFKPEPIVPILEIADTESIHSQSDHSQASMGNYDQSNYSRERILNNQSIASFTHSSDQQSNKLKPKLKGIVMKRLGSLGSNLLDSKSRSLSSQRINKISATNAIS